ncbi:DUF1349 domain-containing protein [Litorihabitans aurantiacus]|uniref:SLH domain-containing protein n=1 Tax=Litorihabitans aurantiacus TaxID=1930061 RepID=A0AA37UUC8_9MICO|nr:DUF1349 domain-containing protein [Litorihabitans aurantiacus]GMA30426.1 hypothetical protein GCM10025875_04180 [Litorihabitans aurantiacus]
MTIHSSPGRRATAVLAAAAIGLVGLAATAAPASADTLPPPPGWPEFGYQGVITSKGPEAIWNPTNEFIFPSVFHAGEHLEDPLAEWYLYYAPHDDPGGISVRYSDSLEGPWTEYAGNPIIEDVWEPHFAVPHVSSADAIWNEEVGRMFLYFHGTNSQTRWAESDDGVTFDYGGIAVDNAMGGPQVTETSYARVFEHPDPDSGYAYGMFYMGNERDDVRRIRLAESVDGREWTVDPDYVVAPGVEEGQNVSSGDLWEWDGELYVIYHASSGKSYARTIDETLREVGETPIVLHEASGLGDDVGRVAAPQVVTDDGETYLFYESGDRLGATIAWAKDGADVVIPPPFGGFPEDPTNPVFEVCAAPGSDEFDGDALAPGAWDRVLREDAARHTVADGALTIPTYEGGVAAAPLLQQELPDGAWQVTTKVTVEAAQRFQQAGLLLWRADDDYVKLDLGQATPGPRLELVQHVRGSNRMDSAAPAIAGTSTIWLRLTSDGDAVRAHISYDGETFERYGRDVADAGTFTHVGPYAFRGTTGAPEIPASFDFFRLSPDAAAYQACLAGLTGGFSDVERDQLFAQDIAWLAQHGISRGWELPDGTREFRPLTPIARDAMAAFLHRQAGSPDVDLPPASPFTDVAPDDQFYDEIVWLAQEGISTGWADGDGTASFRPLEPIGRDAMAAFLYRMADSPEHEAPPVSPFTDMGPATQFYPEVTWLVTEGVATGWLGNDGTAIYRPTTPINRDAMAAFLHRYDDAGFTDVEGSSG